MRVSGGPTGPSSRPGEALEDPQTKPTARSSVPGATLNSCVGASGRLPGVLAGDMSTTRWGLTGQAAPLAARTVIVALDALVSPAVKWE